MLRCVRSLALVAGLAATALAWSTAALAQPVRLFPANALRGSLSVTQPPEVLLNGQAARLAPGARIRGTDNLFKVSGALIGQTVTVHYTIDAGGSLHDVWVLNASEAARQPWPTTPEQAQRWSFDPAAQAWTRR
jgi:hypothetical protein